MTIDFAALFDPPPRRWEAQPAGGVPTGVQAPAVPAEGLTASPPRREWPEAQGIGGGLAPSIPTARPDCPEAILDVQDPAALGQGVVDSPAAELVPLQQALDRPAPTSGEPIQEDRLAVGPSVEPTCPAPNSSGLLLSAEAQSAPTGEDRTSQVPVVEAETQAPAAPTPGAKLHPVWLSIPITSRIYAFDRRDRLCYGPDCYLWTFEQSPVWYYQAETPLPPLRRQGEHYYVDAKAVMELAQSHNTRKE